MSTEYREIAAFDVDDVLLDHADCFCRMSDHLYGTKLTIGDYRDDWAEVWGVSREEAESRRREMIARGLFENLSPVPEAESTLRRLAALDIGLVAITKRRESLRDVTESSLRLHFRGLFSSVFYATSIDEAGNKIVKPKSVLCVEAGARSLTDDQQSTCVEVARAGLTGIHFGDYGWPTTDETHPNLVRTLDWEEVGRYFSARV